MLLYILRHAEAEQKIIADYERRLTAYGHEQAKTMGRFCRQYDIFPELILTSPVVRAKQTAEEVMTILEKGELIEVPWMACGMRSETALQELRTYKNFKSIMIVGHEPDLSRFIAFLLGVKDNAAIEIAKSSLATVFFKKLEPGSGVLKSLFPVELIHEF